MPNTALMPKGAGRVVQRLGADGRSRVDVDVQTGLTDGVMTEIVAGLSEGEHVVAKQTILGYVQPPYGHVHLTEINGTHAVNPLQRGHLTPYRDRTRPSPISNPIKCSAFWPAIVSTESQDPCSSIGIAISTRPRPILRGSAGRPTRYTSPAQKMALYRMWAATPVSMRRMMVPTEAPIWLAPN